MHKTCKALYKIQWDDLVLKVKMETYFFFTADFNSASCGEINHDVERQEMAQASLMLLLKSQNRTGQRKDFVQRSASSLIMNFFGYNTGIFLFEDKSKTKGEVVQYFISVLCNLSLQTVTRFTR